MAVDDFGVPYYGTGASPHQQAIFRDFAFEMATSPWLRHEVYEDEGYVAPTPVDPDTGLPMTQEEIQAIIEWQTFEFLHPWQARFLRWWRKP